MLKVTHVMSKLAGYQRSRDLNSGLPDSVVLILSSSPTTQNGMEKGREGGHRIYPQQIAAVPSTIKNFT